MSLVIRATASLNFVTKFRLTIPIEVMEARWKSVKDLDRLHRQQSCIRDGMASPYVIRAIGYFDKLFGKIEIALTDGRPWIMGDHITLVEVNLAPFIKVVEMLRLLGLFLEDRPHTQKWWDNVNSRPSYSQLEDYPGQGEDDESTHAVTGAQVANQVRALLDENRVKIN